MSTHPGPFASPESAALRPIQMVSIAVGMGALMLSAGVLSVFPCLLLMLMVIGNAEGAVAPLFLTVLYG